MKVPLPGLIREDNPYYEEIRKGIDKMVTLISKCSNLASLLLNRFLIEILATNQPLPNLQEQKFYYQCLNMGVGSMTKPTPGLQDDVWNDYLRRSFHLFPMKKKLQDTSPVYHMLQYS